MVRGFNVENMYRGIVRAMCMGVSIKHFALLERYDKISFSTCQVSLVFVSKCC